MRILIVASLLPPVSIGGAEISAWSLATWLVKAGHQVGVYTIVPDSGDAGVEERDGVRLYKAALPRRYHARDHAGEGAFARLCWHWADHSARANRTAFAPVLDDFAPDIVNLHIVQGAGWNLLAETAARALPVVMTLHDLALACINMAMFRNGRACVHQCLPCRVSQTVKARLIAANPRLALTAPSQSVVDRLAAAGAVEAGSVAVIPNVIRYPRAVAPQEPRPVGGPARLLFVGQIAAHKGVEIAIDAAAAMAGRVPLVLDILGSGRELERLRVRWRGADWVRFHGQVSRDAVAQAMGTADVLLMPSIWSENAPGVIIQALGEGLPVLASAVGGIPEMIRDGENGLLLPPGDVSAWRAALERLLTRPDQLAALGRRADRERARFDPDRAGDRMVAAFAQAIAA